MKKPRWFSPAGLFIVRVEFSESDREDYCD